ncbi:Spermine/spermidine synthase [Pustulibacterium marinum]|uniref:Spermine/spermidine synthase n=1 Tax=Pustulibacterium marinum TaxID=1224947 RepID=A0A1I7G305_9FLAO|nr:fused MFS/spermidine synthase [Pustulibacterium marinum]SFU42827.1 Spermine/spermidine synthase [Pustulibacterium marinum]
MKKPSTVKALSYLYPITTKTYVSELSGVIEITWFNGVKMVDTENANYSYGTLQNILKFGLEKIDLNTVNNVLLLGLGAGSVLETLQKDFNFQHPITAVELDPVMITICKEEFGIEENEQLKIVQDDAFDFLKKDQESYDLIIIDLFIDTEVPEVVYTSDFFQLIHERLTANGQFIFNAALDHSAESTQQKLQQVLKAFETKVYSKVEKVNTLILGSKK